MNESFALSNELNQIIGKPKDMFTREDLMKVILHKQIERLNFLYTGLDGKIKELKIPITEKYHAETILSEGERIAGHILFQDFIDENSADLYVVPQYKSAFLNPFDEGSLNFMCKFINRYGDLVAYAPDNIAYNASTYFTANTGLKLKAMGELEFYLLSNTQNDLFPMGSQSGYHASTPFVKSGDVVNEIIKHLSQITGNLKYAHQDLGFIDSLESDYNELDGKSAEQVEVEFLPTNIEDTGDIIVLARWIIRNIAYRNGYTASFAPKLHHKASGNSMHVQMQLFDGDKSVMIGEGTEISDYARQLIGGLCQYAPSLTAFGNMVPSSYLRLTPANKSTTLVCWSKTANSMIRIPSAWTKVNNLASVVNPQQTTLLKEREERKVVELRSPDGSANAHLLMAGLAMAANWGLTRPEDSMELCENSSLSGKYSDPSYSSDFTELATSCVESSERLLQQRSLYEAGSIFPSSVINHISSHLASKNDRNLNPRVMALPKAERKKELNRIMHRHIHTH